MRPQIVHILTLMLSIFSSISMFAQRVSPPPPGQNRGPELPISNQLLYLAIAGTLLGLFFLLRRAKRKV